MMEITELINHPEQMDRDTLYELRSMLALLPYFQTAPAHYQFQSASRESQNTKLQPQSSESRTMALIDTFLDSIPEENTTDEEKKKRRPTPADATVDYVAYLLENEITGGLLSEGPQMHGQDLIDHFLEEEKGRILLHEIQDEEPTVTPVTEEEPADEEYFTETLARIYIKQGRYQKALDIIQRLSSNFPEKNAYFADQIRFLEKLIINSKKDSKLNN